MWASLVELFVVGLVPRVLGVWWKGSSFFVSPLSLSLSLFRLSCRSPSPSFFCFLSQLPLVVALPGVQELSIRLACVIKVCPRAPLRVQIFQK